MSSPHENSLVACQHGRGRRSHGLGTSPCNSLSVSHSELVSPKDAETRVLFAASHFTRSESWVPDGELSYGEARTELSAQPSETTESRQQPAG